MQILVTPVSFSLMMLRVLSIVMLIFMVRGVMNVGSLIVVLSLMQSWHVVVLLILEVSILVMVLVSILTISVVLLVMMAPLLLMMVIPGFLESIVVIFVLMPVSVMVIDHEFTFMGTIEIIVMLDVVKLVVIPVASVLQYFFLSIGPL